jgi:hypothetical protein
MVAPGTAIGATLSSESLGAKIWNPPNAVTSPCSASSQAVLRGGLLSRLIHCNPEH